MSTDGFLGLRECFAGPNALVPGVIKLGVTSASAVSEPRTTATTATYFPRFRDDAAFGAYGTHARRRHGCGMYVDIGQNQKRRKHENTHC